MRLRGGGGGREEGQGQGNLGKKGMRTRRKTCVGGKGSWEKHGQEPGERG